MYVFVIKYISENNIYIKDLNKMNSQTGIRSLGPYPLDHGGGGRMLYWWILLVWLCWCCVGILVCSC